MPTPVEHDGLVVRQVWAKEKKKKKCMHACMEHHWRLLVSVRAYCRPRSGASLPGTQGSEEGQAQSRRGCEMLHCCMMYPVCTAYVCVCVCVVWCPFISATGEGGLASVVLNLQAGGGVRRKRAGSSRLRGAWGKTPEDATPGEKKKRNGLRSNWFGQVGERRAVYRVDVVLGGFAWLNRAETR